MGTNHDIGRRTIFGNPRRLRPGEKPGDTLLDYERYLRNRLRTDPDFYKAFCDLMTKVENGDTLWCPGCGIGSPTCHGRIMEKVWNSLTP